MKRNDEAVIGLRASFVREMRSIVGGVIVILAVWAALALVAARHIRSLGRQAVQLEAKLAQRQAALAIVEAQLSQQSTILSELKAEVVKQQMRQTSAELLSRADVTQQQAQVVKKTVASVPRDPVLLLPELISLGHTVKRGDVPACQTFLAKSSDALHQLGDRHWKDVAVSSFQSDPNILADAVNNVVNNMLEPLYRSKGH